MRYRCSSSLVLALLLPALAASAETPTQSTRTRSRSAAFVRQPAVAHLDDLSYLFTDVAPEKGKSMDVPSFGRYMGAKKGMDAREVMDAEETLLASSAAVANNPSSVNDMSIYDDDYYDDDEFDMPAGTEKYVTDPDNELFPGEAQGQWYYEPDAADPRPAAEIEAEVDWEEWFAYMRDDWSGYVKQYGEPEVDVYGEIVFKLGPGAGTLVWVSDEQPMDDEEEEQARQSAEPTYGEADEMDSPEFWQNVFAEDIEAYFDDGDSAFGSWWGHDDDDDAQSMEDDDGVPGRRGRVTY